MKLIYEDTSRHKFLGDERLTEKPNLSFEYFYIVFDTEQRNPPEAEIQVDDEGYQLSSDAEVALIPNQFCTSPDSYNQAMTPEMEEEVQTWIDNYFVDKAMQKAEQEAYEQTQEYFEQVLKPQKLEAFKMEFAQQTRPRVTLTISTGEVTIDGGRSDKDNFSEEYNRMQRKGETDGILKDADNELHQVTANDLKLCYEAIVDNFAVMLKGKWQIDEQIKRATTKEELNSIVW